MAREKARERGKVNNDVTAVVVPLDTNRGDAVDQDQGIRRQALSGHAQIMAALSIGGRTARCHLNALARHLAVARAAKILRTENAGAREGTGPGRGP